MKTSCPTPQDLLQAALGDEDARLAGVVDRHARQCPRCAHELDALRETVHALRARSLAEEPTPGRCLDDAEIADLVDGVDPKRQVSSIAHLASCGYCRRELSAVTRLLRDPSVAREIETIQPPAPRRLGARSARLATAAGLVAAALGGVILGPELFRNASEAGDEAILRERAITTTAAPRIVGPLGFATLADSLRWTSVPRADLYRITVWDREGSVVWEGETRDTVLGLPEALDASRGADLLWDVKARTGWDRWVASELVELTVGDQRRNR